MGEFSKLHVWRKAHALALNVHRVATGIRRSDHASLRTQMIRAAMSVPTNIVEGRGQASDRDFCRFLRYSIHSSSELEYHLIMARDVEAIKANDFKSLRDQVIEVRKMLYGLIKSLSKPPPGPSPDGNVPA
jgi:four helix bundle protein